MRRVIQSLCCSRTDSPLADSKQHSRKFQRQDFEHFKKDIISVINNNENIYCLRDGNLLGVFIKTCSKSDDNSYKNMMFTLFLIVICMVTELLKHRRTTMSCNY